MKLKNLWHKSTAKNTTVSQNISPVFPRIPEVDMVNIVSEQDYENNRNFVQKMHTASNLKTIKSVLCFLPCGIGSFLCGGYNTILSLNNALSKKLNCKIYLCFFPAIEDITVVNRFHTEMQKYFPETNYEIIPYSKAFDLNVDIAICNFWIGAYSLLKFNNCKEKYYLIQDHEACFYESGIVSAEAERTLHFGFYKLTNSKALYNYLKFVDDNVVYRYIPGINHEIYYPVKNKSFKKDIYKIIFYGRPSIPRNCFYFITEVAKKVKQRLGNRIEFISVGEDFNLSDYGLENIITNKGRFNDLTELANLYRNCDIGISLISTPTFSYQHLEYMASGLCLVTNNQSGIQDFLIDDENAVICEPVVNTMTEKIIRLINSPETMAHISENGVAFCSKLDWDHCFDGIINFILSDKRN